MRTSQFPQGTGSWLRHAGSWPGWALSVWCVLSMAPPSASAQPAAPNVAATPDAGTAASPTQHPEPASLPAEPGVVQVFVSGSRLPGLEVSLREALGRVGLGMAFHRELTAKVDPQGIAQVRIDVSRTTGASVLIVDTATRKLLESKQLGAAPTQVLEEQLTLLVRTALEAGLELRGLKQPTSSGESPGSSAPPTASFPAPQSPATAGAPEEAPSAGAALGPVSAPPESTPLAHDRGPAPYTASDTQRLGGWVLILNPHVSAMRLYEETSMVAGAGVDLGVEGRTLVGSPGVALGLERFLDSEQRARDVTLTLSAYRLSLLGRWSPLDLRRSALSVLAGPSLVVGSATIHDLDPTLTQTQTTNRLDLVGSLRAEFRWWATSQVALALGASLDIDPAPGGYATSRAGQLTPITRDAQLRPGLTLGISNDFSLSGAH